MASPESDSHSVFDIPPIDEKDITDFGKNYDGSVLESIYRYGLHYTTKEIVLLGGGDEKTGLSMIADSMLVEMEMDEEIDTYRPYDEDIEELVENASKH